VEEPAGGSAAPGRAALALEPRPGPARGAVRLDSIDAAGESRIETGIPELDRVLGGGLVPGSVVLLGGEPGIGKSTLALQLAAEVRSRGGRVLYVSGEESPEQLRLRAQRLAAVPGDVYVMSETRVEALAEPWQALRPSLVVVDSVQTLHTERLESAPGSVAQVRDSAAILAATAKGEATALVLVGQVTKDGSLAGPRVLEHLVDVALLFEGDREHAFRLLYARKNRFGSTGEVGVFAMTESGLEGVANPSEQLLAERRAAAPGSCIVPVLQGSRPLLLEVQALVAQAGYGTARRTCIGVDDARVALLLAILDRHTDLDLVSRDVYVNVTGGVRVSEPAADLGVALAIASSRLERPLPPDTAACGELGLGGEVRRVARIDARLREAARLGFRRVLAPRGASEAGRGPSAIEVCDVAEALAWLRASTPGRVAHVNG
jgi:DNA repair protein RadA/Sms